MIVVAVVVVGERCVGQCLVGGGERGLAVLFVDSRGGE